MLYFTEIACAAFEVLLICLFQRSFFEIRHTRSGAAWIDYVLFGWMIAFLSLVPADYLLRLLGSLLGAAVLFLVVYNTSVIQAFLFSLLFNAIYVMTDVFGLSVLILAHTDTQALFSYNNTRAGYLVLTHLACFAVIAFICLWKKERHSILSFKTVLILSPCWASSILLCGLLISNTYSVKPEMDPLYIFALLGMLYMNILIIWTVGKTEKQEQEKNAAALAAHHYALQKTYYDQLYDQQNDIRAVWHDIHKCIRAAQIEWDTAQSSQELQQLKNRLNDMVHVVDVHNRVLNIILNEYAHAARNAGIRLELDIQTAPAVGLPVSDVYIILGNTLDNALAACKEVPQEQRVIRLKLRQQQRILYYQLDNPYLPSHAARPRGRNNGFGLKNVARCVEKYEGHCEVRQKDGIFTFIAHINCPQGNTAEVPAGMEAETGKGIL